jgi:hypothetical protein
MIHETKHDLTLACGLLWPLLVQEKSNPDVENFTSRMDFNSIVLYLKAKGMNAREIHSDLVSTLGTKPLGYSSVTHWLREAQVDQFSETAVDFTQDAEVDEIDEAILSVLKVQPFDSVCDIPRLTRLARSTVHWHLTRSLGFMVCHLRWIPDVLPEAQNRIRVSNSKQLLAILQEQQGSSWRELVLLDESWFYLHTDHERIWLAPGETPPDRERHTIQSPKFMLTIVWGLLGFMSSKCCRSGGVLTPPTTLLKSRLRLSVGATRSQERPVKNSLSILTTLSHTPGGRLGTLLRPMGWIRLPILHTHQIEHDQTFTYSVISTTDFKDNISRMETSFSMPS